MRCRKIVVPNLIFDDEKGGGDHFPTRHDLSQLDRERYRKIFDFPLLRYYETLGFNFEQESFENLCHKFVDRFMAGFRDLPLGLSISSDISSKCDRKTQTFSRIRDLAKMFDMFNPDKGAFADPIVDAFVAGKVI